jgi:hypothetical protein
MCSSAVVRQPSAQVGDPCGQNPAYRPARPPGTWSPAPTEGGSAVGQQERSRYLSRFLNTSRRPTARRRPKIRSCTLGFVCIALAWRPDAVPGGNIPSQLPAELAPGVGGEIDGMPSLGEAITRAIATDRCSERKVVTDPAGGRGFRAPCCWLRCSATSGVGKQVKHRAG